MANHGKAGPALEQYRAKRRLRKAKNPSKGLLERIRQRKADAEAKRVAAEQEAAKAKEAADLAALEAAGA